MPYANNKGADQRYAGWSVSLLFTAPIVAVFTAPIVAVSEISRLASFCNLAGQFASYLVTNLGRQVYSWRGLSTLYVFSESWVIFSFISSSAVLAYRRYKSLAGLATHWRTNKWTHSLSLDSSLEPLVGGSFCCILMFLYWKNNIMNFEV